MNRNILATLAALLAASMLFMAAGATTAGSHYDVPPLGAGTAGPPYNYPTEVVGQYNGAVPLKNRAMITRTKHGYRFQAGQQNSHLVISRTDTGLRFRDRGTRRFTRVARGCHRQRVRPGIAAVCRVPSGTTERRPLLVEVWPRLGDDYVDGSGLPGTFAMTVLGDAGNDTALLGAGPDFFNGFTGRDRIRGGDGDDWIRSGKDGDRVFGGPGDDQIVDTAGADLIVGGDGNDRLGAGSGNDRVDARGGTDQVLCVSGRDRAWVDRRDRLRGCERIYRS